ncbi:MAG: choice-of-anchor B family protein [Balneolaceae bacterium]
MFRHTALILIFSGLLISCSTSSDTDNSLFTECRNNTAEEYPCRNIGLYAVVTPQDLANPIGDGDSANQNYLNDIWGWTDPETGREYALVGLNDGVTFVDVTEPSEPVVIGKLQEPESSQPAKYETALHHDEEDGLKGESAWRDIKVYENTMYVVSDNQPQHGMQVFDLTQLRDVENPPEIFEDDDDARYKLFGSAHNLAINEETGFAYAVGIRSGEVCAERGGLHMIDLNGAAPEFAGCYFDEEAGGRIQDGYIHDTQCVIYQGPDEDYAGKEICFSSAETVLLITDVDSKELTETISLAGYEDNSYAHQGWLTEDHRYFFMNDELDEMQNGHNTRTYVWDVQDLDDPQMIGFYQHNTTSIDHNLYIYNDIMYQANYMAGLRVLDVSNRDPQSIREIGYFDTTPDQTKPGSKGLWSVYPWFSNNTVVVSDINNGLFILHVER